MVKWDSTHLYVFAGTGRGSGNVTFTLPIGNGTAHVEGENRTLPVTAG